MIIAFKNQGITFIETIIAVAILAIGIVGVLQAFPIGVHLSKTAQMSTIATQLGQAKMEQEISRHYNDVPVVDTTEDYGAIADFSAYKRTTQISCVRFSDLAIVSCDYDPVSDPYPMKKVEIKVYWRSTLGMAENNVDLMSLIVKK